MAGFARLYESLGPLYKGKESGAVSKQPDGAKKSELEVSGQKYPEHGLHPEPRSGSSPSGGSSLRRNKKYSDSDSLDGDSDNKNSSIGSIRSYRRRPLTAGSSHKISAAEEDRSRPLARPPAASLRRDPGRQDDKQTGKASSVKAYDTTDNMRLSGPDSNRGGKSTIKSSLEESDSDIRGKSGASLISRRRRGSDDDGELKRSSPKPSQPKTSLGDFDSKNNVDEWPPKRSRWREESSNTKSDRQDDVPRRRKMDLESSLPLRSSSREEPLNRNRNLPRTSDSGDQSLRRANDQGDSSDSPPAAPHNRRKDIASSGKRDSPQSSGKSPYRKTDNSDDSDDSPPLKSTSRSLSLISRRKGDRDLSPPARKEPSRDYLAIRQTKDSDLTSSFGRDLSPPVKRSATRDNQAVRRQNDFDDSSLTRKTDKDLSITSRTTSRDQLSLNRDGKDRKMDYNERDNSPPLKLTSREEPFNRRKDIMSPRGRDLSPPSKRFSSQDDFPLRRSKDHNVRGEREPLTQRKISFEDDLQLRQKRDIDDKDVLPSARATTQDTSFSRQKGLSTAADRDSAPASRKIFSTDDLPSRRRKDLDDRSDSPPLKSDDIPLHRRRNLDAMSSGASSPPLKSAPLNSLSPRHRNNIDDTTSRRVALKSMTKANQVGDKDSDESTDSPSQKSKESPFQGRSASPAQKRDELSKSHKSWSKSQNDLTDKKVSPRMESKPADRLSPTRQTNDVGKHTDYPVGGTRGDKQQPKSGVLRRSEPRNTDAARNNPSKISDPSSSDGDYYSVGNFFKKDSRHEAEKPSGRPFISNPEVKGPREAVKESNRFETRKESSNRHLKDMDKITRDDLSPRHIADHGRESYRYQSPRTTTGTSHRLVGLDDKKAASSRATDQNLSRDDSLLGHKMQHARDSSLVRTPKSTTSPRTAVGLRSSDTRRSAILGAESVKSDENQGKRPIRDDQGRGDLHGKITPRLESGKFRMRTDLDRNIALRRQTEFDFSKQDSKLNLIRLKRALPANLSGTRYELVEQAAKHIGFYHSPNDDFKTPFLIWTDVFISAERITQLKQFQRVNHFPGMVEISRKDLLAKNLTKLSKLHPSEYNFAPRTWCLPSEASLFQQYSKELQKSDKKQVKSFICKPADGTSGRGIKIYKTAEDVPQTLEGEFVLQEYISNPFLIENVKFDIRLYVLVTSCDPLRVYLCNEGFMRMSRHRYKDPADCNQDEDMELVHLTNSAVNKPNSTSSRLDDSASSRRKTNLGSSSLGENKRSLKYLNEYLQKANYDVDLVWRNIIDLILKTMFAAYPHLMRSYRQCRPVDVPGSSSVCFELFGFDIMLDAQLKPWLLEVNRSPSFDYSLTAERDMKLQVLEETLMLLNVRQLDLKRANTPQMSNPKVSGSAKEQKELAGLIALLARLKRQQQLKEADARICQKFRRIFPLDDPIKQEKLVPLLTSAFPALLDINGGPLQREVEAFYTNQLNIEQVGQELAKRSSTAFAKLTADTQVEGGDSSSEDEIDAARRERRRLQLVALNSKGKDTVDGKLTHFKGKETNKGKLAKDSKKKSQPKQKMLQVPTEAATLSQFEQLASRALEFLNHLSIRFPGKSDRESERLLRDLQDNWRIRKAEVRNYWRLDLSCDKRRKVFDIARQNVSVALNKAFRSAGVPTSDAAASSTVSPGPVRLNHLFEKLYNRLLWSNGLGLWQTFSGRSDWELVLRQSRKTPTEAEMNCCRRVVQLCQDCLLVVFLYSNISAVTAANRCRLRTYLSA